MKNKILILTILTIFCFQSKIINAQNQDTTWINKTLSDFGKVYFGISNEMGDFHSQESYFWGFDLGLYLHPFKNRMKSTEFKIGLGGSWLDNSVNVDLQVNNNNLSYPLNLKYGGIRLGMLFFTDKLFIPSFDVLIASGDLRYQVSDTMFNTYRNEIKKLTVPVYIIMPKINFEIKITSKLKFGWGFSYRIVKGIDVPWSRNSAASDFGYHGTFIGTFGQ